MGRWRAGNGGFVWDDHLQWSTTNPPDVHDPWMLLGAIAQMTEGSSSAPR
jgi:hypothetical protein